MGRPSLYSNELADRICEEIANSNRGLRKICEANDWMPNATTIKRWVTDNVKENDTDTEGFKAKYTRAKEEQADNLVEEMLEIADDKSDDIITGEFGNSGNSVAVARSRLQVDTRKFIASKLKPKKYGERLDLTTGGEPMPMMPPIINIITGDAPPLAGCEADVIP